jgi:hypothetical protein
MVDKSPIERRRMASANALDEDTLALRKLRRLAKNQQLMIASKDGFVLVEDLDEFMRTLANTPLTRQEILREGMKQLEEAFAKAEAQKNGIHP